MQQRATACTHTVTSLATTKLCGAVSFYVVVVAVVVVVVVVVSPQQNPLQTP